MDTISPMTALLLAAGMALAGWFVGDGFADSRIADRYVTVKGISERDVEADLAIWPLRLSVASDDLAKAHADLQQSVALIREFLGRQGSIPTARRSRASRCATRTPTSIAPSARWAAGS